MARNVTVTERKLGRERVDGRVFFKDRLIEVDSRLPPKAWLSTLVHESIHLAFPDATEPAVLKAERTITRILWNAGVRRTHQ